MDKIWFQQSMISFCEKNHPVAASSLAFLYFILSNSPISFPRLTQLFNFLPFLSKYLESILWLLVIPISIQFPHYFPYPHIPLYPIDLQKVTGKAIQISENRFYFLIDRLQFFSVFILPHHL
jgi:hypothetical protein